MQIKTPDPELYPNLSIDDVLVNAYIDPKHQAVERELFGLKWWDYRFMSPIEATFAYIDAFGVEARKVYARDIDFERAEHIVVVTGERIRAQLLNDETKAKRSFSGFWRGRQVADALGMPYPVYIAEAMNNRMRYWSSVKTLDSKGKWRTKLPTATQLYDERGVEKVQARWEELKASRVHYAEHYAYLPQNYVEAPAQMAYCAYLVERAMTSTDKVLSLSDMIENDRLPVAYAAENLDQGLFERVMQSHA